MAYKKLKYWFDGELASLLAEKIGAVYPEFQREVFVQAVEAGVDPLELKARVLLISEELRKALPSSYPEALDILVSILGPELEQETGMFTEGYWVMPIARFVEEYGVPHFEASMAAIEEITKRNTGEYCVRPFLESEPARALAVMERWSQDPNVHVRRLASEGVRPRLPWARKLDMFIADPRPILRILENLKDDPSRFVQKSVANNINDILRDNREAGMAKLQDWAANPTPARRWIIRHALRTLVKRNDTEASATLALLG